MKHYKSLIFIIPLLILGCTETINDSETVVRNETVYKINSETPYTGKLFSLYKSGQKQSESTFGQDGERIGKHIEWYENGQKQFEYTYRDGKRHGVSREWRQNGAMMREVHYNRWANYSALNFSIQKSLEISMVL